MIKRIFTAIFVCLLMISLTSLSVEARAGGGGGSGGGSGGSSSHSSRSGRGRTSSLESFLRLGSSVLMIGGLSAYFKRSKAIKAHRAVKKELAILDDQDEFWNEKRIKQEVENCYYAIQLAWSNQDFETLKDYLTPSLLEQWQIKLAWQEYKGQRNVLKKIRLLAQGVVEIYDSENDDEDCFWVYIEGKIDDRIIDTNNRTVERNNDLFIEYWKFQRVKNNIFLDEIYQQDEFEQ